MVGWELLEHTADVGLRVWADDLDALFAEAARAIVAMMGTASGPVTKHERVSLDAPDAGALLVDWLSEILFLFEARGLVPRDVEITVSRDPWRLEAGIAGQDAETLVQEGPQVKAVTYHGLELRLGPQRCEAVVYLDV